MLILNIPFMGFYESVHNAVIDDAENQLFTDRDTGFTSNEGLQLHFQNKCKYEKVFNDYAKAYTSAFKDHFNIPSLKFIKLNSPREYNFSTDKIECSISRADIRRVYKSLDKVILAYFVRKHCTSRSGFRSFYSPELKNWGYVDNWEYPQLALLLQCYFENHANYSDEWEYSTMQDYASNGYIDNCLYDACPIVDRLFRIHDYLETRKERTWQ